VPCEIILVGREETLHWRAMGPRWSRTGPALLYPAEYAGGHANLCLERYGWRPGLHFGVRWPRKGEVMPPDAEAAFFRVVAGVAAERSAREGKPYLIIRDPVGFAVWPEGERPPEGWRAAATAHRHGRDCHADPGPGHGPPQLTCGRVEGRDYDAIPF
jgi:hypothetical protein